MSSTIDGNFVPALPLKAAGCGSSSGGRQPNLEHCPAEGVSRGVAWLTVLCMLGLCYLMVSVPLLIYSDRTGVAKKQIRVAFAPVGWLHDRTPLRYPLRLYAAMWGIRPD